MAYLNPLHPPIRTAQTTSYTSLGAAIPVPVGRRRVPQPTSSSSQAPIWFDLCGHSRQGVPMKEISSRGPDAIAPLVAGAQDQVLAHIASHKITLRISWPGLSQAEWAKQIDVKGMTRAHLAAHITQHFVRFIETNRSQPCSTPQFSLGQGGILFEHLVLVSLNHISGDEWQADVAV
ncbi:hypothetical protein BJ165DRAFT_1338188 [Panaeolus papilionaceus]|nr:hypothetical protein BJ165DRAFT_1338188 [Panaeolus papilionaceus]